MNNKLKVGLVFVFLLTLLLASTVFAIDCTLSKPCQATNPSNRGESVIFYVDNEGEVYTFWGGNTGWVPDSEDTAWDYTYDNSKEVLSAENRYNNAITTYNNPTAADTQDYEPLANVDSENPSSPTTTATTPYEPPNWANTGVTDENGNSVMYTRDEFRDRFLFYEYGIDIGDSSTATPEQLEAFRKEFNKYKDSFNGQYRYYETDTEGYIVDTKTGRRYTTTEWNIKLEKEKEKQAEKLFKLRDNEEMPDACKEDSESTACQDAIDNCKKHRSNPGCKGVDALLTKQKERTELLNDIMAAIFMPTIGAKKVGAWIQERVFGKADLTENWEKYDQENPQWWYAAFDPVNWVSGAFCKDTRSGFFEQTGPNTYSGGSEWPLTSGTSLLFIYGKRLEYRNKNNRPMMDWSNEEAWFPNPDGTPRGYLYTISFNFQNPYSQSEVDEMSEEERKEKGLGDQTGNVHFRLITVMEDGSKKRGIEREAKPGIPYTFSVSFYSKEKIKSIYIKFLNHYIHMGDEEYFPIDRECHKDTNMGCIEVKNLDGPAGEVVNPNNIPSQGIDPMTGTPVPIGGGSGEGGSGDGDGDWDGWI